MSDSTMHLADLDQDTRFQATVISNDRITRQDSPEEVREITLDVDRPDFSFQVGQSIGVFAPAGTEFGQREHFRLYSVADFSMNPDNNTPRIKIAVRRCSYIDDYSGEKYPGVASNYLCDLYPYDKITIAGPFGLAFRIPPEPDANLILIGTGTGIAPFRAFVKHLYRERTDWKGRVWLFYGANSGLELLYMNEERNDFTQYYDEETFEAFQALSPRPNWADPIGWDHAISGRADELWAMFGDPKTYVYVAGLEKMREELDKVFTKVAGSPDAWRRRRAELVAGERWIELLY